MWSGMHIQTIDISVLSCVTGGMGNGGGSPRPTATPTPRPAPAPATPPADPRYEPRHTTGGDVCRAGWAGAGALIGGGLTVETGPGAALGAAGGAFLGDLAGSLFCPS
jgi:hypothetical protein